MGGGPPISETKPCVEEAPGMRHQGAWPLVLIPGLGCKLMTCHFFFVFLLEHQLLFVLLFLFIKICIQVSRNKYINYKCLAHKPQLLPGASLGFQLLEGLQITVITRTPPHPTPWGLPFSMADSTLFKFLVPTFIF